MRSAHGFAVASAGFLLAAAAPAPAPCPSSAEGTHLFVTTYPIGEGEKGKVVTFKLDQSTLENVAESDACGGFPSWLTQDGETLYCVNEAWDSTVEGGLAALQIGADSTLSLLGGAKTIPGPVAAIVYGDGKGVAVAEYGGGGIDTFNVEDPAAITVIDSKVHDGVGDDLEAPQDQARPHQAILDPTGDFLVFPDLGADLLRVLKVDKATLKHTEAASYEFERGTGPRHGAFLQSGDKTFFYVVTEISNLVQGFSVAYNDDGLEFTQVYSSGTHGNADPLPEGTFAAEIALSPDTKFLTVSSRMEKSLEYTLANGTTVPSDPLITFSVDAESGELTHVQTAPAGGVNPRSFAFNNDGTQVAAALQADSRVVVFERDPATGEIGNAVAETDIVGSPNFVMFRG